MNKKKKVVILFTVLCALTAVLNVSYNYLMPIYLSYKLNMDLRDAKTIGIIGGADGPTAIFVANSQSSFLITAIFTLLSIIGIAYLIISKRKNG